MCDRGKCCVARRHGLYWLRMWPRMCTEVVQIWSWVQARFDRYYHRAVFSFTVDGQNSEPSPPTPIFKVERDPASASIQITIKHNFENWGTGGWWRIQQHTTTDTIPKASVAGSEFCPSTLDHFGIMHQLMFSYGVFIWGIATPTPKF